MFAVDEPVDRAGFRRTGCLEGHALMIGGEVAAQEDLKIWRGRNDGELGAG